MPRFDSWRGHYHRHEPIGVLVLLMILPMLILPSMLAGPLPPVEAASPDPNGGPSIPVPPLPPIFTPPKIIEHSPTGMSRDAVVWVRFDANMDVSTIDDSTFLVVGHAEDNIFDDTDPVAGEVSYDPLTRTASFVPNGYLDPTPTFHNPPPEGWMFQWYEVTLTAGIKSLVGLPVAETTWTFDVNSAFGEPHIIYVDPEDAQTGVDPTADVQAVFDKEMDQTTIPGGFTLTKAEGDPVAAEVTYDSVHRRATLDPSADLEAGSVYEATLSTDAFLHEHVGHRVQHHPWSERPYRRIQRSPRRNTAHLDSQRPLGRHASR